jgi:hypothetical protein
MATSYRRARGSGRHRRPGCAGDVAGQPRTVQGRPPCASRAYRLNWDARWGAAAATASPGPTISAALIATPSGSFTAASSDIRRVVPLASVPWVIATHEQLLALPLDSRAGFVLSLIDSRCTVEMILDIAGLPEDEAIGILDNLRELGAIELNDAEGASHR